MRGAGGFFAALKSCPSPRTRSAAPAGRVEVRAARETDLTQIAAIWNYEVLGTDATTDTEPRDPLAQREWFARHTERYPVVVGPRTGRSRRSRERSRIPSTSRGIAAGAGSAA